MERVRGIEPPYSAWEAAALPLSYTRNVGSGKPTRICRQVVQMGRQGKVNAASTRSPATTVTVCSTMTPSRLAMIR